MTIRHPSTPIKSWLARHHPSGFLLAAQLLQLVLYASFDEPSNQWEILSAMGALILVLVIWVVSRSPAVDWIAWMLAIPAFLLSVFSILLENPSLIVWSSILEAILYFYAAGSMIVYMLSDNSVTTDELFAAGATFTLLAWGFAYAYLVCQALVPDSFINGAHPGQPLTFIELLFLSFTNLSATGLGDILPVSAPARVIAMLEQFSGVGYIAIVVSRLIGLTINFQKKRQR
ncbi:MAG: two pore domain potassium channel family protein [Anaerolineaceae bacterium]|nr:two pore domain potassium channel family protein [Anaerolineaceae bacterium]